MADRNPVTSNCSKDSRLPLRLGSSHLALIANLKQRASYEVLKRGLQTLKHIEATHMPIVASKAQVCSGIMTEIPDGFFRKWMHKKGISLPSPSLYAIGQVFLPTKKNARSFCVDLIENSAKSLGFRFLCWRAPDIDDLVLHEKGGKAAPPTMQFFLGCSSHWSGSEAQYYLLRLESLLLKESFRVLARQREQLDLVSLSRRYIIYKGCLTPSQLPRYYRDLTNDLYRSRLALVCYSYSRLTPLMWSQSQPYLHTCYRGGVLNPRVHRDLFASLRQSSGKKTSEVNGFQSLLLESCERRDLVDGITAYGLGSGTTLDGILKPLFCGDSNRNSSRLGFKAFAGLSLVMSWDQERFAIFSDKVTPEAAWYSLAENGEFLLSTNRAVLADRTDVRYHGPLEGGFRLMLDIKRGEISPIEQEPVLLGGLKTQQDISFTKGVAKTTLNLPFAGLSHDSFFDFLYPIVFGPPFCRQDYARKSGPIRHKMLGRPLVIDPLEGREISSIYCASPILSTCQLQALTAKLEKAMGCEELSMAFDPRCGLEEALSQLCQEAFNAIESGCKALLLSDRKCRDSYLPIPSLLAIACLQSFLTKQGLWHRTYLLLDSIEPREPMHFAQLISFGAFAICPRGVFQPYQSNTHTMTQQEPSYHSLCHQMISHICDELIKIMEMQGFDSICSYHGAQSFVTWGLGSEIRNVAFSGIAEYKGDLSFDNIKSAIASDSGYDVIRFSGLLKSARDDGAAIVGDGILKDALPFLDKALKSRSLQLFHRFLYKLRASDSSSLIFRAGYDVNICRRIFPPGPRESVIDIMRRFSDSCSSALNVPDQVRTAITIAFCRVGARKLVAYIKEETTALDIAHAGEIQINLSTASFYRNCIDSLWELERLIFELRCMNPIARISVLLPSQPLMGVLACELVGMGIDIIAIDGQGHLSAATSWSSQKNPTDALWPWERTLNEAHHSLVQAGLRNQVIIRIEGSYWQPRELIMATVLGAQEWSLGQERFMAFSYEAAQKATGQGDVHPFSRPEHLINYLYLLAQCVRNLLDNLGVSHLDEILGQSQFIRIPETIAGCLWRPFCSSGDDASNRWVPEKGGKIYNFMGRRPGPDECLDLRWLSNVCKKSLEDKGSMQLSLPIEPKDHVVGGILACEIVKQHGEQGLRKSVLKLKFQGYAGDSFMAYAPKGLLARLEGGALDYCAKGLSGGDVIVVPARAPDSFRDTRRLIVGKNAAYGARKGRLLVHGVCNTGFGAYLNGAEVVVEGVRDRAFSFMRAGRAVVLGPFGRDLGLGMTGGQIYLHRDEVAINPPSGLVREDMEAMEIENLSLLLHFYIRHTGSLVARQLFGQKEPLSHLFQKFVAEQSQDPRFSERPAVGSRRIFV